MAFGACVCKKEGVTFSILCQTFLLPFKTGLRLLPRFHFRYKAHSFLFPQGPRFPQATARPLHSTRPLDALPQPEACEPPPSSWCSPSVPRCATRSRARVPSSQAVTHRVLPEPCRTPNMARVLPSQVYRARARLRTPTTSSGQWRAHGFWQWSLRFPQMPGAESNLSRNVLPLSTQTWTTVAGSSAKVCTCAPGGRRSCGRAQPPGECSGLRSLSVVRLREAPACVPFFFREEKDRAFCQFTQFGPFTRIALTHSLP